MGYPNSTRLIGNKFIGSRLSTSWGWERLVFWRLRSTIKVLEVKSTSHQRSQHNSTGCRAWQNKRRTIALLRMGERVFLVVAIRASTSSRYRNSRSRRSKKGVLRGGRELGKLRIIEIQLVLLTQLFIIAKHEGIILIVRTKSWTKTNSEKMFKIKCWTKKYLSRLDYAFRKTKVKTYSPKAV